MYPLSRPLTRSGNRPTDIRTVHIVGDRRVYLLTRGLESQISIGGPELGRRTIHPYVYMAIFVPSHYLLPSSTSPTLPAHPCTPSLPFQSSFLPPPRMQTTPLIPSPPPYTPLSPPVFPFPSLPRRSSRPRCLSASRRRCGALYMNAFVPASPPLRATRIDMPCRTHAGEARPPHAPKLGDLSLSLSLSLRLSACRIDLHTYLYSRSSGPGLPAGVGVGVPVWSTGRGQRSGLKGWDENYLRVWHEPTVSDR